MIDKLKLSLFLKPEYLINIKSGQSYLNYGLLSLWGFKTSAGSTSYDEIFNDETGESYIKVVSFDNEQHPWESIKSSYSGLAVKWQDSNSLMSQPRLEIKASPAKIMQGHNAFGSTSIKDCSKEMIHILTSNFPLLEDCIDFSQTTLDLIDVTYSAPVEQRHHSNLIGVMRNISNGQMRKSSKSDEYESTCYWGLGSKTKVLKCYLKAPEMQRDREQLQRKFEKNPYDKVNRDRLNVMNDERLIEWSEPLVRFEATLKKDWFKNVKTFFDESERKPYYLKQWIEYQNKVEARGECLILNLWKASFKPLLDALSGEAINMQDESMVLDQLKLTYFKQTKKGFTYTKAQKVFDFYMRLVNEGWDKVYKTYKDNRETFRRHLNWLLEATGASKASLQNLKTDVRKNNIVPFSQIVIFDFGNQIPDWGKVRTWGKSA